MKNHLFSVLHFRHTELISTMLSTDSQTAKAHFDYKKKNCKGPEMTDLLSNK